MADKDDLTRLEDLSEYLHEEDPETDKLLEEDDPPEDFPPEFTPAPTEEEGPPDFGSPEEEPADAFPSEEEVDFQESSYEEEPPEFGETSSFEETPDSEESSFEETPDREESSFEETPDSEESPFEEEDGQWQVETAPEVEDNAENQDTFAPLPEKEVQEPDEAAQDIQEAPETQDFGPPEDEPAAAGPPKTYEHFQEVKSFAQNMAQAKLGAGANPPYSLIIREIKSKADADAIFGLLKEHGLVSPQNKRDLEIGLEQNNLLISHISEFAAIFIAHKIRRHCYQILFGLSDEIRPSKHYEPSALAQVGRDSLYQDKSFEEDLEKTDQDGPIFITNSPILENYKIMRYLGMATEHTIVDHSSLISDSEEESEESLPSSLKDLYDSLALKLKPLARAQKGNAIVGVNYQLTPLPPKPFGSESPQYSLTCTGNIVRVVKRESTLE